MTEPGTDTALRTALRALADDGLPVVADVPRIRRAARRRHGARAAAAAVATCVALVAVPVAVSTVRSGTDAPVAVTPAQPPQVLTAVPSQTYALFAGDTVPSTLTRTDAAAASHGWAVVVRADDGSFGRRGAVVTYPVEAPWGASIGDPVAIGDGVQGRTLLGGYTWPVDGGWARVRGDLAPDVLRRIAASVRVVGGLPVVTPPAGHRVVVTTPAVPAVVAEARYGGGEVPTSGPRVPYEGLVLTQVLLGAGLEDDLYGSYALHNGSVEPLDAAVPTADEPAPAGTGRTVPVLRTHLTGGNGDVMWEIRPGVLAVVGISGAAPDPLVVAERSRLVDATTFGATDPQDIPQSNALG